MSDISYISNLSDKAILVEIGNFIQQKRIKLNLTQQELAKQVSISRSTLSLIERGENIALINLIKILRILDALYVLENFKLGEELSPMQLAKGETKKRKRAASQSNNSNKEDLGW